MHPLLVSVLKISQRICPAIDRLRSPIRERPSTRPATSLDVLLIIQSRMLPNPTSVHDLGQKMTNSESSNDKQSLSKLGSLAILGQCFYTGTNFLTAVLVGRWGGAVELGEYSLAFSIAMILYALQLSLIHI